MSLGAFAGSSIVSACAGKTGDAAHATDSASVIATEAKPLFFKISLAEWSLNKSIFGGKMSNLDFPAKAKNDFGVSAVEYVNQFFKDKATDQAYLAELKKRCDDVGVTSVLIMCDGEGGLGDTDEKKRIQAVDNHKKWADAAKFLGCHSIRVNAYGEGTAEEVSKTATDGLRRLSEYGKTLGINVIVENHGGYSSNGQWLSEVIKNTGMENCGTLPDFGNFCIKGQPDKCDEWYDRYKGTEEMMTYAKGVSAKTFNFDDAGNCIETDYVKMLQIVKNVGYNNYIGIEYEGSSLSEEEGILKTKALLERVGGTLS
ncbi:sugar phosphate isomerase/epimerase [Pseudochryseolinea flava]|uniref:Sugar phosphate isomerase/epimerase n=2 Tax=Pseudochryseolinea flava TaxID=2059302 RepID=A0A364Y9E3_9BACT|nr:sugar phosphate isomerase/epimerase [Pseudochryseolinea flava]